jgi:outer membrane lipoprotein-sorting protein
MLKKIAFALVLITSTFYVFADEEAEEYLQKSQAAYGGVEAYKAIKTLKFEVTKDIMGNDIKFKYYYMKPDKYRLESTVKDTTLYRIIDGDSAYLKYLDTVYIIPADQVKDYIEEIHSKIAYVLPDIMDYKKDTSEYEYIGMEKLGTNPYHKIRCTDKDGNIQSFYFDKKDFFFSKLTIKQDGHVLDVIFSKEKKFGNITFPRKIEYQGDGSTYMTIEYDNIEVDSEVDPKLFAKPEGIEKR